MDERYAGSLVWFAGYAYGTPERVERGHSAIPSELIRQPAERGKIRCVTYATAVLIGAFPLAPWRTCSWREFMIGDITRPWSGVSAVSQVIKAGLVRESDPRVGSVLTSTDEKASQIGLVDEVFLGMRSAYVQGWTGLDPRGCVGPMSRGHTFLIIDGDVWDASSADRPVGLRHQESARSLVSRWQAWRMVVLP